MKDRDVFWEYAMNIMREDTAKNEKDELEAKSRVYSDKAVIVLALESGNFAVFNNHRQLQFITQGNEPICCVDGVKCEPWPEIHKYGLDPAIGPINLEDLGL